MPHMLPNKQINSYFWDGDYSFHHPESVSRHTLNQLENKRSEHLMNCLKSRAQVVFSLNEQIHTLPSGTTITQMQLTIPFFL